MKEIIEINKRIMIEAPGIVPKGSDCLFVSRDGQGDKEVNNLPGGIKTDLDALCGRLNELVPNDFNYVLCLGDYNSGIMLEFCDGAMTFARCAESFDPGRSIYEQLEKVDWQKHRKIGMTGGQFFDGVREMSKEIEPVLPPTAEIQKGFRDEIEAFEKTKHKKPSKIYALLWRDDEGVTEEALDSIKSLEGMLCDSMATGYVTLDVIVDGKPLAAKKIDEVKEKVLKEMKEQMPISYARAMGMF
jgi:hypothetical protein